jgi:aminoglycoside phosphotransferase (APT) family kinase protein
LQITDANLHGIRVFWAADQAWLLGDLHAKNIMRDAQGQIRVIDALMLAVPRAMMDCEQLATAVAAARMKAAGADDASQEMLFGFFS